MICVLTVDCFRRINNISTIFTQIWVLFDINCCKTTKSHRFRCLNFEGKWISFVITFYWFFYIGCEVQNFGKMISKNKSLLKPIFKCMNSPNFDDWKIYIFVFLLALCIWKMKWELIKVECCWWNKQINDSLDLNLPNAYNTIIYHFIATFVIKC